VPGPRYERCVGFSRTASAEKWGDLTPDPLDSRLNAARKQWTTNRIELRLISRANPAIVAMTEESGSMVSGEKYPSSKNIESMGRHP
jgi:hypothetical protein